ncbi:hypothetical protein C8Q80DRAFT_1264347 [Daedaleopsis nitida]|nr:hypothetical protein C8Q80DRAFT_1264347 [Daedaleopsis nitida]
MPIPTEVQYTTTPQPVRYNTVGQALRDAGQYPNLITSLSIGPVRYIDLQEYDNTGQLAIETALAFVRLVRITTLRINAVHSQYNREAFYSTFRPEAHLKHLQVEGTFIHIHTMTNTFGHLTTLDLRNSTVPDVYDLRQFVAAMHSWHSLVRLELVNYLRAVDMDTEVPDGAFTHLPQLLQWTVDDNLDKIRRLLQFPVHAADVLNALPTSSPTALPILSAAMELTVDATAGLKISATAHAHGLTMLQIHPATAHMREARSTLLDSAIYSLGKTFSLPEPHPADAEHPLQKLSVAGSVGSVAQHSWERAYRKFPQLHHLVAGDTAETGRSVHPMFAALRRGAKDGCMVVCFNLESVVLQGVLYCPALVEEVTASLAFRCKNHAMLVCLSLRLIILGAAGPNQLNDAEEAMRRQLCGHDLLGFDDEAELTVTTRW